MQSVPTKLSLDRWARIMGVPPMHFWGVNIPAMERACDSAWFQHPWQESDRVSRDDVAQAIAEAESDIEHILGYRLLPTWETDEWMPTVRPFRREAINLNSRDVRGFGQIAMPKWGYLLSGGIRSAEAFEQNATVTYENDGVMQPTTWLNRATVTVALDEEIADHEIAVYYPGHGDDERWRILPVEVSHNQALEYTIRFRREQALVPTFFDSYDLENLRAADGMDDDNFLEAVAVYRVYNDPQQQATLLWEPLGTCGCGSVTCEACAYATQTACLMLRDDPRLSITVYHPATWDEDALAFTNTAAALGRQPDLVRMWYYAGWRDKASAAPLLEMDEEWARIVAYFAASKLDRPVCACSRHWFEQWQSDLAFSGGANELASYSLSPSDLDNPFGTRRGAVHAWRRVRRPGAVIARGAFDK